MKLNIKLSIAAAAITLATTANAGFAGVNFGVGGGQFNTEDPTGSYTDGLTGTSLDLQNTLALEGASNTYAWAYLEHPLPVIPNIRFEMNAEKYEGAGSLTQTFYGQDFTGNINSVADISSNDIILYWGVPGIGLASTATPGVDFDLDFGIGAKLFDGEVSINSEVPGVGFTEVIDQPIPYGYLSGRVEAFGAGLEGQVKYVKYDVNEYSDMQIKVDYTFPVTPVIDLGVEAGYKTTSLTVDVNDLQADISTSGLFFGGFIKF